MSKSFRAMRDKTAGWMRTGISPRRLALTLALGFAIGCIPVLGVPTALCMVVALSLRLNLPAMQAANYAAMPLQIALIYPFVHLGRWMFHSLPTPRLLTVGAEHLTSVQWALSSGALALEAIFAWLVLAAPVVILLTFALTAALRLVPAMASEAGD